MRAHTATTEGCHRRAVPLIAALLVLAAALAFAPRATAGKIYWTDAETGAVGRANLDGTGVDPSFIGDAETLFDVAVDSAHVYWTTGGYPANPGGIGRANLNGGALDLGFITGGGFPEGVAVDAQHVYWSSHISNAIGRAKLNGGNVDTSFITPATGAGSYAEGPTEVAVDAKHVYWGLGSLTRRGAIVGRARLNGTHVDRGFITGRDDACSLAVDSAHVYWTNNYGIGRARLNGTHVDKRFITRDTGCGVAVDAAHVYWTSGDAIGRAKLNGTNVDRSFITGVTGAGSYANSLAVGGGRG